MQRDSPMTAPPVPSRIPPSAVLMSLLIFTAHSIHVEAFSLPPRLYSYTSNTKLAKCVPRERRYKLDAKRGQSNRIGSQNQSLMKVSGLQKVRGGVIKDTEGAESIDTIERDVVDAVQARLDRKRVEDALLYDASNYDTRGSLALQEELNEGAIASREPPSSWAIANAAGLAATIVSFLAVHSLIISGVTFFVITFLASRDPLEEEGIVGKLGG